MNGNDIYIVALFQSVSLVMKAEQILKESGVVFKIIPVPKTLSSECGVCIRFLPDYRDALTQALDGKVEILSIQNLPARKF